eukprot:SAG31_NODE_698_length_12746_cov_3.495136_6_plen_61_part_00
MSFSAEPVQLTGSAADTAPDICRHHPPRCQEIARTRRRLSWRALSARAAGGRASAPRSID